MVGRPAGWRGGRRQGSTCALLASLSAFASGLAHLPGGGVASLALLTYMARQACADVDGAPTLKEALGGLMVAMAEKVHRLLEDEEPPPDVDALLGLAERQMRLKLGARAFQRARLDMPPALRLLGQQTDADTADDEPHLQLGGLVHMRFISYPLTPVQAARQRATPSVCCGPEPTATRGALGSARVHQSRAPRSGG